MNAKADDPRREGSPFEHGIRCDNCHKWFDVTKANVGSRILENTLSGLKDISNPWAECPHCGFKSE